MKSINLGGSAQSMNSLLSQGLSKSAFHQLGLLSMPALHSATQTELCHSITVTLFPIQCCACRRKYRQKHLHFCRTSRWSEKEKNHIQIYKTDEKCGKMWKTRNRFHCTIHNFHVIGPCFTWCPRKILWERERAKSGFFIEGRETFAIPFMWLAEISSCEVVARCNNNPK